MNSCVDWFVRNGVHYPLQQKDRLYVAEWTDGARASHVELVILPPKHVVPAAHRRTPVVIKALRYIVNDETPFVMVGERQDLSVRAFKNMRCVSKDLSMVDQVLDPQNVQKMFSRYKSSLDAKKALRVLGSCSESKHSLQSLDTFRQLVVETVILAFQDCFGSDIPSTITLLRQSKRTRRQSFTNEQAPDGLSMRKPCAKRKRTTSSSSSNADSAAASSGPPALQRSLSDVTSVPVMALLELGKLSESDRSSECTETQVGAPTAMCTDVLTHTSPALTSSYCWFKYCKVFGPQCKVLPVDAAYCTTCGNEQRF